MPERGRAPIGADQLGWNTVAVQLPLASHLNKKNPLAVLADDNASVGNRSAAAKKLVWLRRYKAEDTIDVACLQLGKNARVLHMPGELFVEYQLAGKILRPELFVAMAAYGDYAPGYVGTKAAYNEGGYETSTGALLVAPDVEAVLIDHF